MTTSYEDPADEVWPPPRHRRLRPRRRLQPPRVRDRARPAQPRPAVPAVPATRSPRERLDADADLPALRPGEGAGRTAGGPRPAGTGHHHARRAADGQDDLPRGAPDRAAAKAGLGWSLAGDNQASAQALVEFVDAMTDEHIFPKPTTTSRTTSGPLRRSFLARSRSGTGGVSAVATSTSVFRSTWWTLPARARTAGMITGGPVPGRSSRTWPAAQASCCSSTR